MKTIWVENSTWSNIGDGFYQSSLLHHLTNLFPDARVVHGEGPVARTFRVPATFQKNSFELMALQDADVYVFSGPMLRQLTWRYADFVKQIVDRGKSYAIFSTSAADASQQEIDEIKEFFKAYPPLAVSFRDHEHYDEISSVLDLSISSICAAFLIGDLPIPKVKTERPYLISNFYSVREPEFKFSENGFFSLIPRREFLSLPRKYSRHFDWMLSSPLGVNGMDIMRVRHEPLMKFGHLYYRDPYSFCGMNPLALLSVYTGASYVISDRVHACVAGLALGCPVHLTKVDNRSKLFDQCGIVDTGKHGFWELNDTNLKSEKTRLLSFIRDSLGGGAL